METAARKPRSFGPLAIFAKLGAKILPILGKLLKGLKVGKLALAAGSFAAYSLLWSWQFALVFIASLVFHEMGHISAMKRYGMKTKGIYLIPLLGAAAVSESQFPSRGAEADIALRGPLWGFGLAIATYGVYLMTGAPLAAALAGWMAMLNLFNLLPINPLDGGRLMKSVAYSISSRIGAMLLVVGIGACLVAAVKLNFGLFYVIGAIGALELLGEVKQMRREIDRRRVVAALAKALGVEPNAEAVVDRIKTVDRQLCQGHSAMFPPRLLDENPYTGTFGPFEWSDHFRSRLTMTAIAARIERRTLFRRRPYHVTSAGDLFLRSDVWTGPDVPRLGDDQPLLVYAGSKDAKPTMRPAATAVAFAGYLALAAALAGLMFLTSHVPAADAALQVFRN